MMAAKRLLVDIHTHVYLPRYADVLRARKTVPRITRSNNDTLSQDERLLILEHEPSNGRPVGPQYWDRGHKIAFMDKHGIDISVVSSANPWLDFLPPGEATTLAKALNDDLDNYCADGPSLSSASPTSGAGTKTVTKRLYGFGLLPLVPGIPISSLLDTVSQIKSLPYLRGIILGTRGLGKGLDDPELEPLWSSLASSGLVVFLHPHYGVDSKAFGEMENGHVLPLALGFTFETTTAASRLILSGVLDRHPDLHILLAHSGGALPALSSRLASCVAHDPLVAGRLQHDARWYIGRLWYDAVAYGAEELGFVADVISRAQGYTSREASAKSSLGHVDRSRGARRILFGTDHPFFPPLAETDKWKSVIENLEAIEGVQGIEEEDKDRMKGKNARDLFGIS